MIKHIAALHPSFCNIFNIDIKAFVIYFYNQFPRPTHANGVLVKLTKCTTTSTTIADSVEPVVVVVVENIGKINEK